MEEVKKIILQNADLIVKLSFLGFLIGLAIGVYIAKQ